MNCDQGASYRIISTWGDSDPVQTGMAAFGHYRKILVGIG